MIVPTEFAWDDTKAISNFRRHGISFASARAVFLDSRHLVVDTTREQDRESRQKLIGRFDDRLFAVVFVMRGDTCRLISVRRANKGEERIYGNR